MRRRSVLLVVLALAASCSSSGPKHPTGVATTSTTSTSTTSTTAFASTTTTGGPPTTTFSGQTTPFSLASGTKGTASMSAVRVAGQAGFDRVVFEFSGPAAPGVDVDYDDHPTADGSGAPVAVRGTTTLKVRFSPATSIDFTGAGRVAGDTTQVTEVVRGGDFEAVLTWFVGLRARAPFHVSVLHDPTRVVVDVGTG